MSTAALSLDIEKAFDTTWHSGLLYKLSQLELSTSFIELIVSFLTDGKFKVLVEGGFSTLRKIATEVPQGSVLAPVLYGLYINDASRHLELILLYSRTIPVFTRQEPRISCSLQTATRLHCSEVVVKALEHKDQ
jgi:hypothetical protein